MGWRCDTLWRHAVWPERVGLESAFVRILDELSLSSFQRWVEWRLWFSSVESIEKALFSWETCPCDALYS